MASERPFCHSPGRLPVAGCGRCHCGPSGAGCTGHGDRSRTAGTSKRPVNEQSDKQGCGEYGMIQAYPFSISSNHCFDCSVTCFSMAPAVGPSLFSQG